MAAAVAQGVESRIRTLAQTKRIRIKDYFQDFDKLKGGAVTGRKYILIFITIEKKKNKSYSFIINQNYQNS